MFFTNFKMTYFKKKNSKESKKEGKDQESIQSSTTPDPGYQWENDNATTRHHKREPRGQLFQNSLQPLLNMFLKGYPLEAKTAPKN